MIADISGIIAQFAQRVREDKSPGREASRSAISSYFAMAKELGGHMQITHDDAKGVVSDSVVANSLNKVLAGELRANQHNPASAERFAGRMEMLNALLVMCAIAARFSTVNDFVEKIHAQAQ